MGVEKRLVPMLHDLVVRGRIVRNWERGLGAALNGHWHRGGRSANHGRLSRAAHARIEPGTKLGRPALTSLGWWAGIEALESTSAGHRYQEIGGEYERWSGLAEATVAAHTLDPYHGATNMLRRELAMFAFAATEIEHRSRWRALYRGTGRRVAGLRKLPWSWSFTEDSLLYARILGFEPDLDRVRGKEAAIARAVAGGARVALDRWGSTGIVKTLRLLVSAPRALDSTRLRHLEVLLRPLRTIQPYVIVRQYELGNTFSALLGPLAGRNTGATRAMLQYGPRNYLAAYPYPDKRARNTAKRKEVGAGGGSLELADDGRHVYRCHNVAPDAPMQKEELTLPAWVPLTPHHADRRSGTLGLWTFPDRAPVWWIA